MSLVPFGYAIALLGWIAVAYRLRSLMRRSDDPGGRFFWLTLFCLTSGVTLLMPEIYSGADDLLGVDNISRLIADVFLLTASWSAQTFLSGIDDQDEPTRRTRRTSSALVITLVLLVLLFPFFDAPNSQPIQFTERYGTSLVVLSYRLIFLAYLGFALLNISYLCRRYSLMAGRAALRSGLRLVAVGAALSFVYVCFQGILALAIWSGINQRPKALWTLPTAGGLLAVAILLIGSAVPALGTHLVPRFRRWVSHYRSFRRLQPLWYAIHGACPDIALTPPSSRWYDLFDVRDLDFRLYRRVVEIRDGYLALRIWGDPGVGERARRISHESGSSGDMSAVVEAAILSSAIYRKQRGLPRHAYTIWRPLQGGQDLATEISHLETVAKHYGGSAAVRTATAHLAESSVTHELDGEEGSEHAMREESSNHEKNRTAHRDQHLAHWVTTVFHPVWTVSALLLAVAWHASGSIIGAAWGLAAALLTFLVPVLYVRHQIKRQRIANHNVRLREQRLVPLLLSAVWIVLALTVLSVAGAPRDLRALLIALTAGLVSFALITVVWKISFHVAVTAGIVVILSMVFGAMMLVLVPLVALVGWARITLEDHTWLQVIVGGVAGAVIAGTVFDIVR